MAKHITKTVIEDIAYQLKSAGQWTHEARVNPQVVLDQELEMDFSNPEEILDDLTIQLADVLASHDPTFDRQRFMEQSSYKVAL